MGLSQGRGTGELGGRITSTIDLSATATARSTYDVASSAGVSALLQQLPLCWPALNRPSRSTLLTRASHESFCPAAV